ncbi:hypothetical protein LTR66_002025 [Elasticomyces elasticus]|nr:hypothetical protein LTR66_002025 [Elasticomyces elasticus]
MPPRLRFQPKRVRLCTTNAQYPSCQHRNTYASLATATTTSAPLDPIKYAAPPIARYPPTQPPSYKPPEFRKSQLLRQYASLLRSSPLMLLFQHNNLKSVEWMGIRREFMAALSKVDADRAKSGHAYFIGGSVKMQIVQTGIFAAALRVVEFYHPELRQEVPKMHSSDPRKTSSASLQDVGNGAERANFTHGLSESAHEAAQNAKLKHGLEPLLSGPLCLVTLPDVSLPHLKAVLSILAPSKEFPAPKRKTNPGYHEVPVQAGLQKLMLLGARVEGKVFDTEGTRWVGGIEGGIDGLRAQLVAMLGGIGAGVTSTLESAGRSLYFTVEGRRGMLEDEAKGPAEGIKEG